MDFLNQLLRGIAFVPALVNGIEGLFASKSGSEKKDAAMSFLENALQMSDAIAQREIVNADQFRDGVSRIIDGVVECMNASAWAKTAVQTANVNPQKQFHSRPFSSGNSVEPDCALQVTGKLRRFLRQAQGKSSLRSG